MPDKTVRVVARVVDIQVDLERGMIDEGCGWVRHKDRADGSVGSVHPAKYLLICLSGDLVEYPEAVKRSRLPSFLTQPALFPLPTPLAKGGAALL
jgi:hypothetical protein